MLNVLFIAMGIGYAFSLNEATDSFGDFIDGTSRQSDVQSQILPVFGVAFAASMLNNLIFNQFTTATTATTTTTVSTTTASTTTVSTTAGSVNKTICFIFKVNFVS